MLEDHPSIRGSAVAEAEVAADAACSYQCGGFLGGTGPCFGCCAGGGGGGGINLGFCCIVLLAGAAPIGGFFGGIAPMAKDPWIPPVAVAAAEELPRW